MEGRLRGRVIEGHRPLNPIRVCSALARRAALDTHLPLFGSQEDQYAKVLQIHQIQGRDVIGDVSEGATAEEFLGAP